MNEESQVELTCWLCGRPFESLIQWHHPVPKSKKGRGTVPVHPICHKTIHANFTNAELARIGDDPERILEDEAVAKFVKWISTKPPDFSRANAALIPNPGTIGPRNCWSDTMAKGLRTWAGRSGWELGWVLSPGSGLSPA